MRTCGDCSECCRLLAIQMEEYYTPQGHWCKYCTKPGCSIYNTSIPKSCKDYFCGWIQNEDIPDEYKPNLSGIVLEVLDNNPNTTKTIIPNTIKIVTCPLFFIKIKSRLTFKYLSINRYLHEEPK